MKLGPKDQPITFVSESYSWTHVAVVDEKPVEYTSVWIKKHKNKGIKIFYCHQCRYPVFQYEGDIVTLLPGSVPSPLPILCQCKGKNCGHKYVLHPMTD